MPKSTKRNKKQAAPSTASNANNKEKAKNAAAAPGSKKRKFPTSFLNAQSLEFVVGLPQQHQKVVHTPVASDIIKEIFLDRLVKELVQPYCWKKKESSSGLANKKKDSTSVQHVMVNGKLVARKVSAPPRKVQSNVGDHDEDHDDATAATKRAQLKSRMVMGTNQCSRLLERLVVEAENTAAVDSSSQQQQQCSGFPNLIVLAKDVYPPTMLAHIPVLAQQLDIPILLLPGKASVELGEALQIRRTSILIFLSSSSNKDDKVDANGDPIDSFVSFIKSQMSQ